MVFRSHHVPQGIMKLKRKEFQDLKQGSMTVGEYVICFTQLSRYAPNDVDTDEKKQDCFLNDLNNRLAYALEVHDFENFQAMVNKAFVLENRRGFWNTSTSRSVRVNIAPTPGLVLVLHPLDLFSAPCSRMFNQCHN
jgi:hypothetical protein